MQTKNKGLWIGKKKVAERVRVAETMREKFWGLMGKKEKEVDYALVFTWKEEAILGRSIHMLFMQFPIQVLFLNRERKIVDQAILTPWQLNYTPKKPCQYVVEIPAKWKRMGKREDIVQWKK